MKKNKDYFKNKSFVISVHVSTTGPGHDLRDYLLSRGVKRLLFIAHPLLFFKENVKYPSTYELYIDGKKTAMGTAWHIKLPESLLYIKDFFLSLYWTLKFLKRPDVFVGVGNLNAFSGLILKYFGFCNDVIYYVIDFVPRRFQNDIINNIYHWVEKKSALDSSWTWNLSPRMISGREKKWGRNFPHQIVVPHGVHIHRIVRVSFENINNHELIYMGTLLEKQGIQLVIAALPQIKEKVKDVSFVIIGRGPYESELRRLVKKYKLEQDVHFLGYIEKHKDVENRIAKAGVAVALYDKKTDMFSYFADPGKIKNYLGAGVPVVMTKVPFVANEVAENKCGFIVDYKKESLALILSNYFSNERLQREYRKNALIFAQQYEWEKVFDDAFSYAT